VAMTDRRPAWYDGALCETLGAARVFHTTDRYPLFYLKITKCGCTYLVNLLHALDHGVPHPAAGRVHSHEEDFVKAGLLPDAVVATSPYAFAVVRDPVDRFLSLYFDKIADTSNENDEGMRRRVVRVAGLSVGPGVSLEGHRDNCLKVLDFFEANLAGRTKGGVNPHWQRQVARLRRARDFPLKVLTLDGLTWQLPTLLAPLIPDISERMAAVRSRNTSKKPFNRAEIETPELAQRVHSIYAADLDIYRRARADWGPAPDRRG
jgi:hypothetical protein